MRKSREFSAYGVRYKCLQFAAVEGLRIFGSNSEISPIDMLSGTWVMVGKKWVPLTGDSINKHVADTTGLVCPYSVLRSIVSLVHDYNFSFLNGWVGTKVPTRFQTGIGSVNSKYSDPMIATITGHNKATLRELEEYYSVEDAFKMFDMLVANGVNEASAQEEARKKAMKK